MSVVSLERTTAAVFGLLSDWSETKIVWPNLSADTKDEKEWIEPRVVDFEGQRSRRDQPWADAELQIKIFVRSVDGDAYRLSEIADMLRSLTEGQTVETTQGAVRLQEGDINTIESPDEHIECKIVRIPIQCQEA